MILVKIYVVIHLITLRENTAAIHTQEKKTLEKLSLMSNQLFEKKLFYNYV